MRLQIILKTHQLLFLLFFSKNFVSAQTLTGTILDIKNQPLAGSAVSILKLADSTVYRATVTDALGKFQFKNLPANHYFIRAAFVGFVTYYSPAITINAAQNKVLFPVIVLKNVATQLREVVVTNKRPLIEQKIDRTIINVDAMLTASGSHALDVLSKSPGVLVDINDNINLLGKGGVSILIDGKFTHLSSSDMAAYLRSLPAGIIDKLELISNPPARYDAAGGAIINIILKKNKTTGLSGNFSLGINKGIYVRSNDVITLMYRKKKLNFLSSISYSRDAGLLDINSSRQLFQPNGKLICTINNSSYYNYFSNGVNARIMFDYQLNPKNNIGFLMLAGIRPKTDNEDYTIERFNENNLIDSLADGGIRGNYSWKNLGLNANYLHQWQKPNHTLNIDVDYIRYTSDGTQLLPNNFYTNTRQLINTSTRKYDLPGAVYIYSVKTDYAQPFSKQIYFETGLKINYVQNNTATNWYDLMAGNFNLNEARSNHYNYSENIKAAYVSASGQGKRWGIKFGFRAENTQQSGHLIGNQAIKDSAFNRSYLNIFPTGYLFLKLDSAGNHTLTLETDRRIRRPGYQQLNPFLQFQNAYSYSTGNPFLLPQYAQNIGLRYNQKKFFSAYIFYSRVSKLISNTIARQGELFITRPENFGSNTSLNLAVSWNIYPAKWWELNANFFIFHLKNKGMVFGKTINEKVSTGEFRITNQLRLSKNWSGELSGFYATEHISSQIHTAPFGYVGAGIQKKILGGKGMIKLKADDIFWTIKIRDNSLNITDAAFSRTTKRDSRIIGFSFNYSFGKTNNNKRSDRNGGTDDEQRRAN